MVIRNATVIRLAEAAAYPNSTIRIRDGSITSVEIPGTGGEQPGRRPGGASGPGEPEAGEAIDAGGGYVLPGLVNLHAHTAMAPLRGAAEDVAPEQWFNDHIWIYEQNITPDEVYWGTTLGALEMLCAGVTAVADHYFHMDRAFAAYVDSGMRANLAQAVFGVGESPDRRLDEAVAFTREHHRSHPRISVSLGPHSPYLCPDRFLRRTVEEAGRLEVPVHIHVSETARQVEQSKAERGKTPVEVLRDTGVLNTGAILAHAYHAEDGDLKLIADSGASVAHCPKTFMKFGDASDLLPRALKAGVRVGLGTDGAASNSTMNVFEVARDAALLAKIATGDPTVAPLRQVLPLLTAGGDALGLPNYGEVVAGAPADLVVVSPDNAAMQPALSPAADLLYSLNDRAVRFVIVDGQVVVRDGRHAWIDREEVFARNREMVRRVVRRTSDTPMQRFEG